MRTARPCSWTPRCSRSHSATCSSRPARTATSTPGTSAIPWRERWGVRCRTTSFAPRDCWRKRRKARKGSDQEAAQGKDEKVDKGGGGPMTQRERSMLTVLLSLVGVMAAGGAIYLFFLRPLAELNEEEDAAQDAVNKKDLMVMALIRDRELLKIAKE